MFYRGGGNEKTTAGTAKSKPVRNGTNEKIMAAKASRVRTGKLGE